MHKEIKNSGQGTLFDNPFLEKLTKAPAYISVTIYLSIIGVLLYTGYREGVTGSYLEAGGVFLGAMFFWTLFEYIFHRYINHLDDYFPNSKTARKVAYTLHGIHHEFPRDEERLIMPPIPGLLIVGILYLGFEALLGLWVYLFMPGFMLGYLLYTYIHYSTHQSNVPAFLKTQYKHHSLHHYKYPDKAFGVSTTLWDRVFGTMPPEKQ